MRGARGFARRQETLKGRLIGAAAGNAKGYLARLDETQRRMTERRYVGVNRPVVTK